MSDKHCDTCICGSRAPVQRDDEHKRGPGTISWEEHLLAHSGYIAKWHASQTAERMAERGGFSYGEVIEYLGREPTTWEPRRIAPESQPPRNIRDAQAADELEARAKEAVAAGPRL